jgi:hypothetical protein
MQVNGNLKQGPGVIQMYDGTFMANCTTWYAVMGITVKEDATPQPHK